MLSDTDLEHLRRCVELAAQALEAGDEPFGSLLVSAPVATLPIQAVVPGATVDGPAPELADAVRELHMRFFAAA